MRFRKTKKTPEKPTDEELLKGIPHETEEEIWEQIEGLGAIIFREARLVGKGELDNSKKQVSKQHKKIVSIQLALVEILEQKYNVIPPTGNAYQERTPAPEGKINYWDWYDRIRNRILSREYKRLPCRVCPFSEGLKSFVGQGGGKFPCDAFSGWCKVEMRSLYQACAMRERFVISDARHAYFAGKGEMTDCSTSEAIRRNVVNNLNKRLADLRINFMFLSKNLKEPTKPGQTQKTINKNRHDYRDTVKKYYKSAYEDAQHDRERDYHTEFLKKLEDKLGRKGMAKWRKIEKLFLTENWEAYEKEKAAETAAKNKT